MMYVSIMMLDAGIVHCIHWCLAPHTTSVCQYLIDLKHECVVIKQSDCIHMTSQVAVLTRQDFTHVFTCML